MFSEAERRATLASQSNSVKLALAAAESELKHASRRRWGLGVLLTLLLVSVYRLGGARRVTSTTLQAARTREQAEHPWRAVRAVNALNATRTAVNLNATRRTATKTLRLQRRMPVKGFRVSSDG